MTPEIEKRIKAVRAGRVPAGYKKTAGGIVPNEWNETPLENCLVEYKEKTTMANQYPMLTSARAGLMLQSDYYSGHQVTTDDNVGYNVLPRGYVTFRSRSDDGRFKFNENNIIDKGIISYFYPVFSFNNSVDYKYMLFLLNETIYRQMFPYNEGTAQMVLSFNKLKSLQYSIPPICEQKKIAEILATQDRVLELKEKLIAAKQSQKKYLMSVLLGDDFKKPFKLNGVTIDKKKWEKKRIEDVAIMSSGSTPRRDSKDNFCGNILWLSSGELKQKYICDTEEKISDKAAKESNLRVYPEGTFVIAMYGLEAAGIRGTASIIKAKSTISQACMAFTDLNNITNEFLYYWYLYNGQIIGSKYAQGSKQQNLNSDLMGKIQINLPSLPEQKAIADVLSAADEEISLLQKDLEQEKLKKKSLIQLLLTGLVRVA